jgi:Zn-dependent protease with chaperone function
VVSQIFHDLVGDDTVALLGVTPTVVVERAALANAYARSSQVVITLPLLQEVSDRSELAFVIAHELSHLSLGHTSHGGEEAELEADSLALKLVRQAGFNPCAGSTVLKRLSEGRSLPGVPDRLAAIAQQTAAKCDA